MSTPNSDVQQIFHVLPDRVLEGGFVAIAKNPTCMVSNYPTNSTINDANKNHWQLTHDTSKYPSYSSDSTLLDAVHNLSLEELIKNTKADRTFRTGALWPGVWTRDISYAGLLSLAFLNPEVCKTSLRKKIRNGRVIQDTGTGGAYPVSTDRVVWVIAAWEVFLATGDKSWLKEVFPIVSNTLSDDIETIYNPATGLMKGESSFLDWREQTYPHWMQPADIADSEALGTNIVHFRAHQILEEMSSLLGEKVPESGKLADTIKSAISRHFWIADPGYLGQYLYGRRWKMLSRRSDALGAALAVIFDAMDEQQQQSIIRNTPVTTYGVPCIYPQITGIPPYHNDSVWPFVQAFWALASAKAGNESALSHSVDAILRPVALFLTNKENFVATNGDPQGTAKNSDRQLWSVAGSLAIVYRVFFGMKLTTQGLELHPFVPEKFKGSKRISGFNYRNCSLEIDLHGWGNEVAEVRLDGHIIPSAQIGSDLRGEHHLSIQLSEKVGKKSAYSICENKYAPETPRVKNENGCLSWQYARKSTRFDILLNGKRVDTTFGNSWQVPHQGHGEYQIVAVDENGIESFACEPLAIYDEKNMLQVDLGEFANAQADIPGFTGKGYLFSSIKENPAITFEIVAPLAGEYFLNARYSNGNGPINTDSKCALRSLLKDGNRIGTLVFPQRGTNDWTNWGESNWLPVYLDEGRNLLSIQTSPYHNNMDGTINEALLDSVTCIRIR